MVLLFREEIADCEAFRFDPDLREHSAMYQSFIGVVMGLPAGFEEHAHLERVAALWEAEDTDAVNDVLWSDDIEDDDATAEGEEGDDGGGGGGHQAAGAGAEVGFGGRTIGVPEAKDMTAKDRKQILGRIYNILMSTGRSIEAPHKLLSDKGGLLDCQEYNVAFMVVECCSRSLSFEQFFPTIALKLCQVDGSLSVAGVSTERLLDMPSPPARGGRVSWRLMFERLFLECYSKCHQTEVARLANIAKFFAFLFCYDGLPWDALKSIRLAPDATTTSTRVFLKYFTVEIAAQLSPATLRRMVYKDQRDAWSTLFPTDSLDNVEFALTFYENCGLAGVTKGLRSVREHYLRIAAETVM